MDRLAYLAGMSDTYFRRLFSERFGKNPLKYINELRLQRAKELLSGDYYTVEEVSELCGFNNVSYFSIFFKREVGIPPSVYRENL